MSGLAIRTDRPERHELGGSATRSDRAQLLGVRAGGAARASRGSPRVGHFSKDLLQFGYVSTKERAAKVCKETKHPEAEA